MGPVHSPAAVTIPLQQHSKQKVFQAAARNFTIRLAEKLAKCLCSLMRRAETECLLYATYWFRPILSELIGAATESANVNRDRAPSGPVKVKVVNLKGRKILSQHAESAKHCVMTGLRP